MPFPPSESDITSLQMAVTTFRPHIPNSTAFYFTSHKNPFFTPRIVLSEVSFSLFALPARLQIFNFRRWIFEIRRLEGFVWEILCRFRFFSDRIWWLDDAFWTEYRALDEVRVKWQSEALISSGKSWKIRVFFFCAFWSMLIFFSEIERSLLF